MDEHIKARSVGCISECVMHRLAIRYDQTKMAEYALLFRPTRTLRLFAQVLSLGFLDGCEGTAFHVLQGFWYRFLVDMKLLEVRKYMRESNTDAVTAIYRVLGIEVRL